MPNNSTNKIKKKPTEKTFGASAYGGAGWVARKHSHENEIGNIWSSYRIDSEWKPLKSVLIHEPGKELLAAMDDPEGSLMLAPLDIDIASAQHQGMADAYKALGIDVHYVDPLGTATPNLMFCADLLAMTPQGAILARPAGQSRAGEERWVARRLAELGIPILKTLTGDATFEGADLMWLDEKTAMIGRGHRTNQLAIEQITTVLNEIDCDVLAVDLPFGTMHFMGMLRIVDKDLAICWPRRTPVATVRALEERGYQVAFAPFEDDGQSYRAMNNVTLGPRKIMVSADLPKFEEFFESLEIEIVSVVTDEISKAAGNIGCLTSVLSRDCS